MGYGDRDVRLVFRDIRDLEVVQPADWVAGEGDQIEREVALTYKDRGSGPPLT